MYRFLFYGNLYNGIRLNGIHLQGVNRLRGGIRLRGMCFENSSSEFVFACGWKVDTRTAGPMYLIA